MAQRGEAARTRSKRSLRMLGVLSLLLPAVAFVVR